MDLDAFVDRLNTGGVESFHICVTKILRTLAMLEIEKLVQTLRCDMFIAPHLRKLMEDKALLVKMAHVFVLFTIFDAHFRYGKIAE
ncbi:hypothetical protein ACFL0S_01470 [Thermodesulfobacteriota bacterium]